MHETNPEIKPDGEILLIGGQDLAPERFLAFWTDFQDCGLATACAAQGWPLWIVGRIAYVFTTEAGV